MSSRGLFIVLEGLDGSGTTTQTAKLHDHLKKRGLPARATREPTDEAIGRLIRAGISGGIESRETGEKTAFSEIALCLLFAADRAEHSRLIEEIRATGTHIICDRYLLSSIAYQSLDPAITPERVVDVNRGCSVPDATLFLKVPVDECLARLEQRNYSPTVYERKDVLAGIDRNYETTRPLYEKQFGPLISIDGTKSANDVHADIVKQLATILPQQ